MDSKLKLGTTTLLNVGNNQVLLN